MSSGTWVVIKEGSN